MPILSSSITIHPLSREGFHEVSEIHTERLGSREFESHGVFGYIYPLSGGVVWCNARGKPISVFGTLTECQSWLESNGRTVEWL